MLLWLLALVPLLLQGCAITIDKSLVYVARDPHLPPAAIPLPADMDRSRVTEIAVDADGQRFLGYRLAAPSPQRAVLFFTGNGYGAPTTLQRTARQFSDEHTDVYVLSYGQPGQPAPDIRQIFAMGRELAALAARASGVGSPRLVAVGHSLGGWVAMHLAGTDLVGCAVLVGAGTTAVETAAHLTPRWLAWAARFRPTPDVALLDNIALAQRSRVPTFVVGSDLDEVMPAARSRAIFSQLPAQPAGEIFVSATATHGSFFREPGVVQRIRGFMRGRCPR